MRQVADGNTANHKRERNKGEGDSYRGALLSLLEHSLGSRLAAAPEPPQDQDGRDRVHEVLERVAQRWVPSNMEVS